MTRRQRQPSNSTSVATFYHPACACTACLCPLGKGWGNDDHGVCWWCQRRHHAKEAA